jgi:dCMP deaminase
MLIGVVGPRFSGKKTLASHLIAHHGFRELEILPKGYHQASNAEESLSFESFAKAINHATSNWRDNFVLLNIHLYPDAELAFKRPFFLLVCVQAPTLTRFERRNEKYGDDQITLSDLSIEPSKPLSMESPCLTVTEFLTFDEQDLYQKLSFSGLDFTLCNFIRKASLSLFNDASLDEFTADIDALDLDNEEHVRPSWDTYFMSLCELASKRSNCMKRRVGCILVSENRVISTGYNGTPRNVVNCNQGGCPRCNGNAPCGSSLDHCICLHAEEVICDLIDFFRMRCWKRDESV